MKFRGTVDVFNLSDENDMDDLDVSHLFVPALTDQYIDHIINGSINWNTDNHIVQISVSLGKDQPNTPLLDLMKRTGTQEVRRVLGDYVRQLKSGL